MNKIISLLSMLSVSIALMAQTSEQSLRIHEIKSNESDYFYGESVSTISYADAFNAAVQDMARQAKSTVDIVIIDSNSMYDSESIIKSAAAFNNLGKIEFSKEEKGVTSYVSFVYLSKTDYNRQVKEAEARAIERIESLISDGIYQEGRVNIADALRNFGWALQLCKQYKYEKRSELTDNRPTHLWLDDKIKSILESVEIILEKEDITYDQLDYDHYTVNLMITYCDRPVSNLDITYFNNEENRDVLVKNGRAALKFPTLSGQKNVKINIKYCYDDPEEIEEDMARAFRLAPKPSYDRFNTKVIPVTVNATQSVIKADPRGDWGNIDYEIAERSEGIPARVEELYKEAQRDFIDTATEGADLLKIAVAIEDALRNKDYESVSQYFSAEALAKFRMMYSTGEIRVSMDPVYKMERATHYIRCSNIPVTVKNGKHSRNESIILRFDPQSRLVSSIAYGLTETAENDIFRSADWHMDSRYAIVKFMEDYQTAYTTKDINYLDMIFNGKAIIITGTVPKNFKKNEDFMQNLDSNENPTYVDGILYQKFTKDQYLKNLREKFARNSYIHLKYHDAKLSRAVTPPSLSEAFMIQLKQDFNSSKYDDKGYLTLQVGMKPSGSQIYLRTWTPNRISLSRMKSLFPFK